MSVLYLYCVLSSQCNSPAIDLSEITLLLQYRNFQGALLFIFVSFNDDAMNTLLLKLQDPHSSILTDRR
jgi:hypothetical protein